MATWEKNGIYITMKGQALINQCAAGGGKLEITRVTSSSERYSGIAPEYNPDLNDIEMPRQNFSTPTWHKSPMNMDGTENSAYVLEAQLSNREELINAIGSGETGYYLQQIGVFGHIIDQTSGEVGSETLIFLAQPSQSTADFVPVTDETSLIMTYAIQLNMFSIVGDNVTVNVTMNDAGMVSAEQLEREFNRRTINPYVGNIHIGGTDNVLIHGAGGILWTGTKKDNFKVGVESQLEMLSDNLLISTQYSMELYVPETGAYSLSFLYYTKKSMINSSLSEYLSINGNVVDLLASNWYDNDSIVQFEFSTQLVSGKNTIEFKSCDKNGKIGSKKLGLGILRVCVKNTNDFKTVYTPANFDSAYEGELINFTPEKVDSTLNDFLPLYGLTRVPNANYLSEQISSVTKKLNNEITERKAVDNTKVDKTQYMSIEQAGIAKLYSKSVKGVNTNRSGLQSMGNGEIRVAVNTDKGTAITGTGELITSPASEDDISAETNGFKPIVPSTLRKAVNSITQTTNYGSSESKFAGLDELADCIKSNTDAINAETEVRALADSQLRDEIVGGSYGSKGNPGAPYIAGLDEMAEDVMENGDAIKTEIEARIAGDIANYNINTSSGSTITVTDAADYQLQGLNVYGNSTQNGTPTPTAPIDIVSVGDSGSIDVTISNANNSKSQTLTIPLTEPLRGIGDIKDIICVQDGKLGVLRKISKITFSGTESFTKSGLNIEGYSGFNSSTNYELGGSVAICNYFKNCTQGQWIGYKAENLFVFYNSKNPCFRIDSTIASTVDEWKSWLTSRASEGNPLKVLYQLKTPVFTPFDDTVQSQYQALTTYLGRINLTNSGNADMSISYMTSHADVILKKIKEETIMRQQADIDLKEDIICGMYGNNLPDGCSQIAGLDEMASNVLENWTLIKEEEKLRIEGDENLKQQLLCTDKIIGNALNVKYKVWSDNTFSSMYLQGELTAEIYGVPITIDTSCCNSYCIFGLEAGHEGTAYLYTHGYEDGEIKFYFSGETSSGKTPYEGTNPIWIKEFPMSELYENKVFTGQDIIEVYDWDSVLKRLRDLESNLIMGTAGEAEILIIQKSASYPLKDFVLIGKCREQSPHVAPTNPYTIQSVGDSGSIQVTIANSNHSKTQILILPLDEPLRGVGGVSDTICVQDGKLGVYREFGCIKLTGKEHWTVSPDSPEAFCIKIEDAYSKPQSHVYPTWFMCSHFKLTTDITEINCFKADGQEFSFIFGSTIGAFITWLDIQNTNVEPVTLVYRLGSPIFTPFDDKVQRDYRSLLMYEGTTFITNNDKYGMAQIKVSFIVSTKLYLEAKIEEEKTARIEGDKANLITNTATGSPIIATDAADYPVQDLSIYGNSTQDGTPTPDAPIDIVSVGDSGSIDVTISNADNSKSQVLTLPLAEPLCRIGNMKDTICVQDGKLGVLRYFSYLILNGDTEREEWVNLGTNSYGITNFQFKSYDGIKPDISRDLPKGLCNRCIQSASTQANTQSDNFYLGYSWLYVRSSTLTSKDDFLSDLSANPLKIIFPRSSPVFIPFDDTVQEQYKAFASYVGTIKITNSDSANMSISYVADTKAYIDNKFNELNSAITALS